MNILITGGTGLIGQRLIKLLTEKGHATRLLSRAENLEAKVPCFQWSIKDKKVDLNAFDEVDVLIHLAGANVAEGKWSDRRKKEIMDSRVESTKLLFKTIESLEKRPKLLICSSATGFYGIQNFDHVSSENDDPGEDFLANVCVQWENEASKFNELGMRVVQVRTGVVLDEKGGALPKMTMPIRFLMGAPLGSGNQHIPWIHWQDWCEAVLHLIQNEKLHGPYNLVAPNSATNRELTRLIAKTIHRPMILPNVPKFLLKMIFEEMSSVILEGHQVSSKKLEASGYNFKFESADKALMDLLGQH